MSCCNQQPGHILVHSRSVNEHMYSGRSMLTNLISYIQTYMYSWSTLFSPFPKSPADDFSVRMFRSVCWAGAEARRLVVTESRFRFHSQCWKLRSLLAQSGSLLDHFCSLLGPFWGSQGAHASKHKQARTTQATTHNSGATT